MRKIILFFILAFFVCTTQASSSDSSLSVISQVLTHFARSNFHWQCNKPNTQSLNSSHSVQWSQLTCRGKYPPLLHIRRGADTGDLKINLIDTDLSDPHIELTPVIAKKNDSTDPYKQKLVVMGHENPSLLAGINGGYFYINSKQRDINCFEKTNKQYTSDGIGDGLLIIHSKTLSTNCRSRFFAEPNRSTILLDDQHHWMITAVPPHTSPNNIIHALGAGPGLIQTIHGKPEIRETWEGIVSSFEFSANSAVILAKDSLNHQHVIFFTVDGIDKEKGMYSTEMANFIYNQIPSLLNVKLISAMSLDQGGSTTMYVRAAHPQIITQANRNNSQREIFNGLFVREKN